jgi:SpoVK/Ycf46/Vps4 family AAA+-type ATPase
MAENGDWLNWELVSQMWLDKGKDNTKDRVNLAVLIIEDIGGTELSHRDTSVSSEMLNFLDGNSDVFKIPTLIIGTTNFINLLGSTLCDRPGRFDKIIEVLPPKDSEIKILAEEFLGRPLEKDEENAIFGKKFTPAYCKEIIIRHELYNITIAEAAKELEEQRKKSREQKHGNNKKNTGFGDW